MTTDPLWIPATIAAAAFQVGRNALQRGLAGSAGPWGATLVRFLFGLPFSACLALAALTLCPHASPRFCAAFWLAAAAGGASQVLATAALLSAMRRSGFAIGTALQQSSLPLAALIGLLVFDDHLSAPAWIGVAVTTAGLFGLGWPALPEHRPHAAAGAAFGVLSGLLFGFSLNAFRHAALALDGRQPVFAAILTLFVVQAMQTLVLTGVLLLRDPAAVGAVLRSWRRSLGAGLCGTLASTGWFVALVLAPAAPVRALGVIETPIAALAGHRLFRERLGGRQVLAGVAVAVGIVLTAL